MNQSSLEGAIREFFSTRAREGCSRERELCRHVAGVLDGRASSAFRAHLEKCSECREVLADLQTEGPSPWRLTVARRRQWRWYLTAGATVAIAAALLVMLVVPVAPDSTGGEPLTPKGPSFALHVAAERDGRVYRVNEGMTLETGDRLGFFYSAAAPGHLMIFFVDDVGTLTRLFPADSDSSAPIEPGAELRIPDGALLSEGSGCEWIVGVFSAAALTDAEVRPGVRTMWSNRRACELGALPLRSAESHVLGVRR